MKRLVVLGVLCLTFLCLNAQARGGGGWSWNIGYHNPPGSLLGLNLFYLGDNFGFEIGVGNVDSDDGNSSNNNTDSATASGALSIKYLFRDGQMFRPYLQAGTGLSIGASSNSSGTSAGAGVGEDGYYGLGFFLMGSEFYFYASYNVDGNDNSFNQAGIGFDF